MFNALVMGLTGSVTVGTARELFGNDAWRLRRTGTLFAFCGLFILFGSVMIRDCFTTFLCTLTLWGLVRWLVRPRPRNLLVATSLTGVSAYAMAYLRSGALVLLAVFWLMAVAMWFRERTSTQYRPLAASVLFFILPIAAWHFESGLLLCTELQQRYIEGYREGAEEKSASGSLGLDLVVNQPLPARLVLGTGMLMVSPIPLWKYFAIGAEDYHWIKGYHGVWQVLALPLLFAGFLAVLRQFRDNGSKGLPLLFLVLYLSASTGAVVATSLEQRHLAQFMPAFIVIAALPDTRETKTREEVGRIRASWLGLVVLVHLAWAVVKRMA